MAPSQPDSSHPVPAPPEWVEPPPARISGREPDDGWTLADPWPMGPVTRDALHGIIRALCPRPPAPWSEEIAARIELGVRVFLRYLPPVMGLGFGPMLILLDWSPLWRLRGVSPLHRWERAAAAEHMQRLANSRFKPIRLMIMAARAAVLSVYYDQDEVHAAMGYDPLPFLQGRADLRRRLMAGEEATPSDLIGPHAEVLR
jgi:hypothetical protein